MCAPHWLRRPLAGPVLGAVSSSLPAHGSWHFGNLHEAEVGVDHEDSPLCASGLLYLITCSPKSQLQGCF